MYAIPNATWITDECCKFGKVTLRRDKVDEIFGGDQTIWNNLRSFCKNNYLSLIFDPDNQSFTFELKKEGRSFNFIRRHSG
jgi:hypothetical protein